METLKTNNEKIDILTKKAFLKLSKAEYLITEAVQLCAKEKGFENCKLFSGVFNGGFEVVVSFNNDGETADLILETMMDLSKEEIIDFMKDFVSEESLKLLN